MTSKKAFNNKKTFEEEHNIALTKQTYSHDLLDLNPQNWFYLYQQIKSRGLNVKQIHKNILKYDHNVQFLIETSHNFYFDKVTNSRLSMKQKIAQYNNQLRMRLAELFEYIGLLHLEELQNSVEFMYESMVGTIAHMINSIEQLKQSNYRLQNELEDWKLKKKNVLCFSCKQNVQEAKLRNLTCSMGQTKSEQIPTECIDRQYKMKQIQTQCRSLEMELTAMSEEHFFNSESECLVELINEALKTKIILGDNNLRHQSTITVLGRCVNQLSQLGKPFEMDNGPVESVKEIKSSKRLGQVNGARLLSIKDLGEGGEFVDKLKRLFEEPIHRFVEKYQAIIMARCMVQTTPDNASQTQRREQQTQTSLVKQPQLIKNYEKQISALSKELALIKSSKHKSEKEVFRVLQQLQKNESKTIELVAANRLLQSQNAERAAQNQNLSHKLKRLEKQVETDNDTLLRNFTHQKAGMHRQIAQMEDELQQIKHELLQKTMKYKYESKGVQTFNTAFYQIKNCIDVQIQTPEEPFSVQNIKSTKKSILKTLKSIRLKSKLTNDQHDNEFMNIVSQTNNIPSIKKQHNKSRSQIPSTVGRNLASSRRFHNEHTEGLLSSRLDMMLRTAPIGENVFAEKEGRFSHMKKHTSQLSMNKVLRTKKNRKPSINSMIPESMENSKSYLTSNNLSLEKQEDLFREELHTGGHRKDKVLVEKLGLGVGVQGLQISGLSKKHDYHRSDLSHSSRNNEAFQQFSSAEDKMNLCNFTDISNILTSSGDNCRYLVSKLKKIPKNHLKDFMRTNPVSNKKKVIIKSSLQTQRDRPQGESGQGEIGRSNKQNPIQNGSDNDSEVEGSVGSDCEDGRARCTMKETEMLDKKGQIVKQIVQRFEYFDRIGLISLFEQLNSVLDQRKAWGDNQYNSQKSLHIEQQLTSYLLLSKHRIHKSDISLFFSLEQATKYETRTGLWNELDSCIMVDNNFSKLTDQVGKYFQYLKEHQVTIYNECVLFLYQPCRFLKEILHEKDGLEQSTRVIREMARIQTGGCRVQVSDVKELFRKLIRVHKVVHKKGCRHVEEFLKKIGFQEFTINQRDLRTSAKTPKTGQSPSRTARRLKQ